MPRVSLRPILFVLLALTLFGARSAGAADGVTVRLNGSLDVTEAGDGKARLEIVFGEPMYAAVKAKSPDPRRFLQDLAPDRADYEMTGATARYDDARTSVVLDMVNRAAAKNRGAGRWEFPVELEVTLVRMSPDGAPRPKASFQVKGDWGNGVLYEGEFSISPPATAKDVRWDATSKLLSWRLDPGAWAGAPRLSADFRARDRIMSTIYKVYGLGSDLQAFWLAKTVFRNDGQGVARNLKVRYRLQGYGDWSPWEKHPEVVPGQTVVSVHYPVLDAAIAKLKTNTPANLLLEFTYEDEAGRKLEDDGAKKLVVLGVNEFVFGNLTAGASFGTWQEDYNNAPLLAAWVSRNDGAVKQFASMANRMAGGVGASSDDASALKVLRACYELLQANDFTYQHPPALTDQSVSFDPKRVQNVKFPRETMRDRSGTCIDLAILFAAMANAVGLEPHLALIPGHCFPLIRLPSGRFAGVETTGIQGGRRTGSAAFSRVQPYADDEYAKAKADGRIYELDVRALWTRGISNPEMEELPPDILERWGISEEGRPGPRRPPSEPSRPEPSGGPDAVLGLWGGAIGQAIDGGTIEAFVVGIDKASDGTGFEAATRADVTVAVDGQDRKVVVITRYRGATKGEGALFESTERTRTVDGGAPQVLAQGFMLVTAKGGRVEVRVGNDDEGYTDFTLSPKKDEAPTAPESESQSARGVRGTWGGDMSKASLGSNVYLDQMYVDVPAAGAWRASVRMNMTLKQGTTDVPLVIVAEYEDGRVDGESVRWEKVAWHRTVTPTGQKSDIEGNPLVLTLKSDGGLSGKFEGGDGFTFSLLRRGAPPAPPATAPVGVDVLAGSWGGSMNDAELNKELSIRDAYVDAARKPTGGWTAAVRMTFLVHTASGDVVVTAEGTYTSGRVEGDAIQFAATKLTRTVVANGQRSPMDGNPLELRREPDGRIEVKFVGEGGFTLTLMRR